MCISRVLLLVLALSFAGCASRLDVSAPHQVDLTGHWALNPKLSMDPDAIVRDEQRRERNRDRQPRSPDERQVGGVLDNSPSRPPEAGVRGGSAYGKLWEKAILEKIAMLTPGTPLDIAQKTGDLTIVSGDSSIRYVYGDKVIVSVPDGVADRIAGWEGRRFIVRTSAPDGVRTLRSFELANGGNQLIVITEVNGEGPRSMVRLVYDKKPA
jgi:hypothetical protein